MPAEAYSSEVDEPRPGPAETVQAITLGARVRLLDVDPDLGVALQDAEVSRAVELSTVHTMPLKRGEWSAQEQGAPDLSLYIISGVMARRVSVEGRSSLELLGPGQLLRPTLGGAADTVASELAWKVLAPTWVGVLDHDFWRRLSPYPAVWLALLDRGLGRARSLSMRLAIVGVPNLATRVRLLLWHLADNYGRVTERGVVLDLRLSHGVLAELVSASRPSVSKAIKDLERRGELSRSATGGYVLHGAFVSPAVTARANAATVTSLLEKAVAVSAVSWPL